MCVPRSLFRLGKLGGSSEGELVAAALASFDQATISWVDRPPFCQAPSGHCRITLAVSDSEKGHILQTELLERFSGLLKYHVCYLRKERSLSHTAHTHFANVASIFQRDEGAIDIEEFGSLYFVAHINDFAIDDGRAIFALSQRATDVQNGPHNSRRSLDTGCGRCSGLLSGIC